MKLFNSIGYVLITFLVLLTLISSFVQKSNFNYKKVPNSFVKTANVGAFNKNFVDLTKYLPTNFVKDGSVDYTSFIQKGIDENSNIRMPNFPVLINDKGLFLRSNSTVLFQSSSRLFKSSSSLTHYSVLNLDGVSSVKILNPTIVGDRNIHKGNSGEWGMGININASTNISIYNSNISNCWGDGIYIGNKDYRPSSNIWIEGGVIDNNRRNAISVISGKQIVVKNIVLSNSNGTLPTAGIDIEPNSNNDVLENISIDNVITFNNADAGFLIYLGSMLGSRENNVTISLTGSTDYYSPKSLSVPGLRNDYSSNIKRIKGNINIQDFTSNSSKEVFARSSGNYIFTPKITIGTMKVLSNSKRDIQRENDVSKWMKARRMKN